jgi:L-ribulokinase
MAEGYLVGLDFGTESARGVLIDVTSGDVVASHTHRYAHGTMTHSLGHVDRSKPSPSGWALQDAADYIDCTEIILCALARGKEVRGIGVGFTASSPLPALEDGTALSHRYPNEPHAYVKLWKHQAAQPWADAINAAGGAFLRNFGGRISGEWLLPKAAQLAAQAPALWNETARFIEAGDWLVWQLTGNEVRSPDMARFKAQFSDELGYPQIDVPGFASRVRAPSRIGSSAGPLSDGWRERTGIRGEAAVSLAVIDSHVLLPAIGAVEAGTLGGAVGTSAGFMLLDDIQRAFPEGVEGVARDAALPDLWCYEAGQAGFGDLLAWLASVAPIAADTNDNFTAYNAAAAGLRAGQTGLLALDWWNGCRVPFSDPLLSGMIVGLRLRTTPVDIYRALLEALCFGSRTIVERMQASGAPVKRIVIASGLSRNNPLLMQIMADVLGQKIEVPNLAHITAVGAAIHGAVAGGMVANFAEGATRFGAREYTAYRPSPEGAKVYEELYGHYRKLTHDHGLHQTMHRLAALGT